MFVDPNMEGVLSHMAEALLGDVGELMPWGISGWAAGVEDELRPLPWMQKSASLKGVNLAATGAYHRYWEEPSWTGPNRDQS